ncbi:acyl carrier protein, partial [Streptomyces aculeolatus]
MVKLLKNGTITTVAQALADELGQDGTDHSPSEAPSAPAGSSAAEPLDEPAAPQQHRSGTKAGTPVPLPAEATGAKVLDFLKQEVATVMGLRPERVNVNRPLNKLGMDSL